MHAQSGQITAPPLEAWLAKGVLAGEWVLNPSESTIRLKSRVMGGLVAVKGTFGVISGYGTVSAAGDVSGVLMVSAASIDTKNSRRDTHLRSADFFDSDNSPDITYAVDGIQPAGQGVRVTGALTVRGRSRPLSFDAAVELRGDRRIGLDAEVDINRKDFGLTWNFLGSVSATSTLTVRAMFARQ